MATPTPREHRSEAEEVSSEWLGALMAGVLVFGGQIWAAAVAPSWT